MKKAKLPVLLGAISMIAASIALADIDDGQRNDDWRYKDLYELKQLHEAFHKAISHGGIDAAAKAKAVEELLALWTDDGTLITGGVTYTGKGKPNTASCDAGALTLCDFYEHHAGGLVLGHNYVSLTPIFTEAIHLLDHDNAEIYFQCIYFDVADKDVIKSNVTFGLPHTPARAVKVNGHWLFSYAESGPIAPPTLDVY